METTGSAQQFRKSDGAPRKRPIMSYALWGAQGLLALVYLSSGVTKLIMSAEDLNADFPMPDEFMRFIAVAELLGALGLILPGVFHIRRALTPVAAGGLMIIMTGATVLTIADGDVAAVIPFVLGLLAAFVAYGRRSWLTTDSLWTGASPPSKRTVTTPVDSR